MSEYQYYEFQAIDRPLGEADMEALRTLSTRARITATSFTNHYEWGDFKGDPRLLMELWFDVHLYLANWGTRRLMLRLPKRLVDQSRLESFLYGCNLGEIIELDEHLILDVCDDGEEADYDGWDDGSGWLGALAPLRSDLLSGDWRLPYLLWLAAVAGGGLRDDALEPLAGIGPLTGGLEAFARFFRMDLDLVRAAAERTEHAELGELSSAAALAALGSIPDDEKTELLRRFFEGDPLATAALRRRVREAVSPAAGAARTEFRTVSDLRSRAAAIREERQAAEAEEREAERRRQEREAQDARRARLDALRHRGEAVWREVESEVGKRNAKSYDRATELLLDLKALAEENGTLAGFFNRLDAIRLRHERKRQFIERLAAHSALHRER